MPHTTKKQRKITHSFSPIESPNLTHDELLQLNHSNKEEIEILDDTEMIQFNNNDEEPTIEDYLDYTKYGCLEASMNQSVAEDNFNEFLNLKTSKEINGICHGC